MAALALNNDGSLLASSSETGTLIRIWDTENGNKLQELRRGSDQADVYCLSFDPASKYLSCSSNKGTIHIFALRSDLSMAAAYNNRQNDDVNGQSQSADPA